MNGSNKTEHDVLWTVLSIFFLVSLVLPEDENENKEKSEEGAIVTDLNKSIEDKWYPQIAYASDKAILMEVEDLEEKVFSASLQVKVSDLWSWYTKDNFDKFNNWRFHLYDEPMQVYLY